MSTPDAGIGKFVGEAVADAKALIAEKSEELQQLDMLDPLSPDDVYDARQELGPDAGNVAVLAHARAAKKGRPPGARNKRTDDFARWILGFGQHPAITMMQIQTTPPEVLVENSRRKVTKLVKGGKDKADKVVTFDEVTLTYEAAQSLRQRAAEGLLPYLESKKPVAIDATIRGVRVVEEVGGHGPLADMLEGEFLRVATSADDAPADDEREEAA